MPVIQKTFRTVAVAGQSSVVADSATDTLTLVAGDNVEITTNAGADSVTFSADVDTPVAAAIATHEGLSDPHPQYLTATEGNAAYQPLDGELTALAGLTSAADKVPYFTGAGTAAVATLSSAGRALIDDADAAAQRATLGLGTAATSNTGDFDAAGAASSAVSAHAAASDPHTGYQKESEKGAANGYASLDSGGLVPVAQLPSGSGVSMDDVVDTLYPVGAIYVSTLSTNPATLLGRGTWSAFGAGRVLVGHDSGDADFDTSEETGGSKTATSTGTVSQPTFSGTGATLTHSGTAVDDHAAHTHSVTSNVAVGDHAAHTHSVTSNVAVADHAAHTHSVTSNVAVADHGSHTHTYTDVPNHVHVQSVNSGTTGALSGYTPDTSTSTSTSSGYSTANPTGGVATGTTAGPNATLTHSVTNNAVTSGNPSATLSHSVTNNAVTSGNPSATLSHSVTNNAVTSGNPSATLTHTVTQPASHSYTPAGTVTQPTYTGNATSIVQPYIVVYFWKRTA